jgi:hypothetical protein
VRTRTYVALRIIVGVVFAVVIVSEAAAFYPFGFFDIGTGELIYPKWKLSYMDVNGDGDVSGTDEGVLLNFETGLLGFTEEEKAKVIAGLETWEAVPSSYMAFHYGQDISDPVEQQVGLDTIDLINIVSIEVAGDPDPLVAAGGSYVYTFTTSTFEGGMVDFHGVQIPVSRGEMLDIDTVYAGELNRQHEADFGFGFQGISVLGAGSFIGLGFSPFDNYDEAASSAFGLNIEKRVVYLRDGTGVLRHVGVTPTMLNSFIYYDEGSNKVSDSLEDLAPDDIAGVTFLYPRADQELYFDLSQTAKTQTRDGFPSLPISGAHIMAWCDTDNNPLSGPVPFIDTLTGLYSDTDAQRGDFVLRTLFKQLEDSNGNTFAARYTITCKEFEPFIFDQSEHDTTHGGSFLFPTQGYATTPIQFDSLFPSEVFNEYGNIGGVTNVAQGTPLFYNSATRKVASVTTGKSLETVLSAGRPMFGDPNLVCPLNVVVAGMKTNRGPSALRHVRDATLLNTALGAAVMDAYYRVAPSAAEFLLSHGRMLAVARLAARGAEWVFGNGMAVLALLAGVGALAGGWRWRKRVRAIVMPLILIAALCCLATPAAATFAFKDMDQYVAASDEIVTGKVTAADSHWTPDGAKIVTDITIAIDDVVKGRLNKSGKVHLTLPIGRVGPIGRSCPQLPTFTTGEEVLVFLEDRAESGYLIVGALTGKYNIRTDEETGEKTVYAGARETKIRLQRAAAKLKASGESETENAGDGEADEAEKRPGTVSLDDFKGYLRDIDKEQRRAK